MTSWPEDQTQSIACDANTGSGKSRSDLATGAAQVARECSRRPGRLRVHRRCMSLQVSLSNQKDCRGGGGREEREEGMWGGINDLIRLEQRADMHSKRTPAVYGETAHFLI